MFRNTVLYRRMWYVKRRQKNRLAFYLVLMIIFFGTWLLASNIENRVLPILFQITETEARAKLSRIVNTSVMEVFVKPVRYNDLVQVTRDDMGRIASVQTDMEALNRISAEIVSAIQKKMQQNPLESVGIPIGTLTGAPYLSAVGPEIPVGVKSTGTVETDFKSEFSSSGINQTRHRIVMQLTLWVSISAPLREKEVEFKTTVPLAETVIVGNVPQYYQN